MKTNRGCFYLVVATVCVFILAYYFLSLFHDPMADAIIRK